MKVVEAAWKLKELGYSGNFKETNVAGSGEHWGVA